MFSILFSDNALKQLRKLDRATAERIISVLERARIIPYSHAKKLVASPYFRIRAGDYRIIIDIKDRDLIILVIEVGHRKNIYQ